MWMYEGREFRSEDINGNQAFVYLLTDRVSGLKYVGTKAFYSTRTLPPLKGKTRKRKKISESDWQTYIGSSETIKAIADQHGINRFDRTILHLCQTKAHARYMEMLEQVQRNVLFDDAYANGIVNVRINRSHVKTLNLLTMASYKATGDKDMGHDPQTIQSIYKKLNELHNDVSKMKADNDKRFGPVLETKVQEMFETKRVSLTMMEGK